MPKPVIDGREATVQFSKIKFEDYGQRALDPNLSLNEKVGFPDDFRETHGDEIWSEFLSKLPALRKPGAAVFDIGCGCGELPRRLIENGVALSQTIVLGDHENMLNLLPSAAGVHKVPGEFPDTREAVVRAAPGGFDAIICYSVLQVVAQSNRNPFLFVDSALELLKPGGRMLIGDIPNVSKLRRFLSSEAGAAYHRTYMRTGDPPDVPPFALDKERLDDGFLLGLLAHARTSGFDAFLMPQLETLPMSARREDIVVVRP